MQFADILLSFDWHLGVMHGVNPMLWLTTACYGCAAFLSHQAQKAYELYHEMNAALSRRVYFFWRTIVILLIVFGLTELFDIQHFLTHTGRQIAKAGGWYHNRAPIQRVCIWCFVGSAVSAFFFIAYLFRRVLKQKALALFGIAFLCAFVAIRSVSYHFVDSFLNSPIAGIPMNWLCEWLAILLISLSAILSTHRIQREQKLFAASKES